MGAAPGRPVYTVGHSNHPIDRLLALLAAHGITRVLDVRVGRGTPVAVQNATLYRVEPKPERCP